MSLLVSISLDALPLPLAHCPLGRRLLVGAIISAAACAICLLGQSAHAHPEAPGAPQRRPLIIVNATVHTAAGPTIADGAVMFDKGKIVAVGKTKEVQALPSALVIDGQGKHVYPGLIDAGSSLGLVEINAVRATRDYAETGSLNPNVRAETAVNPDSELIPVTRSNGVLAGVILPSSGLVSGRGALMHLDGWTWEDMTIRSGVGLQVNWPRLSGPTKDDAGKSTVPSSLTTLEELLEQARDYRAARRADPSRAKDIKLESLLPVLDGDIPVLAAADELRQIQSAVQFCVRHQLKLIIQGGYDAAECAALLKQHDVPVALTGVHRLPNRRSDAYDAPFTLPSRLTKAGVAYCIGGAGRFGGSNLRNLPYHAATAVAYGLEEEEALRAITLYPAQIFGAGEQMGSLEPGKIATLFIADGNILETETTVEQAWIHGRTVSLNNRHKRLWEKYQQKYRQLGTAR